MIIGENECLMIQAVDFQILDWIQANLKSEVLDWIMPIITALGDGGIFWILLGVICLAFTKSRKMGAQMLLAMALGFVIGNLGLKIIIARQRPYTFNESILLLIKEPSDFSFPSGHTLASFAAAITIFFYQKKFGIAALILAALIAFSRLYLYVHFPSDILGGLILAVFVAYVAKIIVKILNDRQMTPNA